MTLGVAGLQEHRQELCVALAVRGMTDVAPP